jgi:hypothetical protein
MKKKKSMQRENQNSSTISHRPKKTVNVNVVVHGDNQSNESSLSQKQDNRVYQEPIPTLSPSDDLSLGKPDEGLKEQLARSIQNLDIANDLASQKNIVLPTTLQNIPKSILDVKSSNDIRNLIKHIDNMVLEINKLTSPRVVPSVVPTATQAPQAPQASQAVPTFNNPPNPFRYAQPPPQYTPYVHHHTYHLHHMFHLHQLEQFLHQLEQLLEILLIQILAHQTFQQILREEHQAVDEFCKIMKDRETHYAIRLL